jgi:peptidoglycan hydrolase FlgJ
MTPLVFSPQGHLTPSAADEPAVPPAAASAVDPALRARAVAAAEKFEAFFIAEMLKQMRRSSSELAADDSPFKNKVNQDMLDLTDTLMGDSLAGQRAFGIADAILRQLLPETAADLRFKVSDGAVAPHRTGAEALPEPSADT